MSAAPEICYNFSQLKDVMGGLVLILWREGTATDTATDVSVDLVDVAADKVLILTSFAGRAVAGAGQVTTDLQFFVGENPPPSFEIARGAGGDTVLNWSGNVWVPPDSTVSFNVGFDAGANANTVQGVITGLIIPRGNVQQG